MNQPELPGVSIDVIVPNPNPAPIVSDIPEKYRCLNCRRELLEEEVIKSPLDFVKKADGTLEKSMHRFSAFCKICNSFIKVVDPEARQYIQQGLYK